MGRPQGRKRTEETIEGTTHKISTAVSDEVYNWIVSEAKTDGITTSAFIFRTLQERMRSERVPRILLQDPYAKDQ